MADNITLDSMSGGSVVAADDISSVFFQRIKLVHGADGVNAGDVSTSNGLPVSLIAGSASIGILGANSGVDIGDVTINNASGASAVNIQDGGNNISIDDGGNAISIDIGGTVPLLLDDNTSGVSASATVNKIATIARNTLWFNGNATWERTRQVENNTNSNGSGIQAVGLVAQFDDTAPTLLTENQFGNLRSTQDRVLMVQPRVSPDSTDVVIQSGNIPLEVFKQPVHVSSNGEIVVSGIANRKIRVLEGMLMASATVTISLKSSNNKAATGPLPLTANQGFIIPYTPSGNFETIAGQNLTISTNAAATIGGWLTYVQV